MEIEIKFNETFEAPMARLDRVFSTKGRYAHTYMPTKYTEHKNIYKIKMPKLNLENALIELEFYFTPPKSWSKKRKLKRLNN